MLPDDISMSLHIHTQRHTHTMHTQRRIATCTHVIINYMREYYEFEVTPIGQGKFE